MRNKGGILATAKAGHHKLLITGIPGTGKTTIGNALELKHAFKHINLEGPALHDLLEAPAEVIASWAGSDQNIVITWRFVPDTQTDLVLLLKSSGFKLVWFDGNREAARRAFNARGDVAEQALDIQLCKIERLDVVRRIGPLVYDTFKVDGTFRKVEEIITDLKNL